MILSVILLSLLMILLSTLSLNLNWLFNLNLIYEIMWTGVGRGLLISMLEKLNCLFFKQVSLTTLVLLMWVRCWGCLFLLNWTVTIALSTLVIKLPPRKFEPWFVLLSFFLLRLLFISINLPYSLAWNTVAMSGLMLLTAAEMLNKLQKQICRTVVPSLFAFLESLDHCRKIASLSFFICITMVDDVHSNWPNWFHFLILDGGLLYIQIDYMILLSSFLDVTRISMSTVSFLAQLDPGILC